MSYVSHRSSLLHMHWQYAEGTKWLIQSTFDPIAKITLSEIHTIYTTSKTPGQLINEGYCCFRWFVTHPNYHLSYLVKTACRVVHIPEKA
jgi:hypothetical protein